VEGWDPSPQLKFKQAPGCFPTGPGLGRLRDEWLKVEAFLNLGGVT
jgi:hypothetical protein